MYPPLKSKVSSCILHVFVFSCLYFDDFNFSVFPRHALLCEEISALLMPKVYITGMDVKAIRNYGDFTDLEPLVGLLK